MADLPFPKSLPEFGDARPLAKPRTSGPSGAHVHPRIKVSVDPERRAAWARAAKKAGVSLVAWLRAAGDERAGYAQTRELLDPIDDGLDPGEPLSAESRRALERGLADARAGRVISTAELRRRLGIKKSTRTPK